MKLNSRFCTALAASLLCGIIAMPHTVSAKQGATDPIPGTSKGATNSGGNKSSSTPTPTPAPTPAPTPTPTPTVPAIAVGSINFTASGPVNGIVPVCTGDFRVDPYYPTLLDMTLNVNVSSMNVPDGTVLYVNVVGTGGTLYPYTSNAIVITGGAGFCSEKVFVTLGAGLAGVVVTDATGTPVFAGN